MSNRIKDCKIDVVSISLDFSEESEVMTFEEILLHPEISNQEKFINHKSVEYKILESNDKYIVGFLRCILDKDLPAKIDKSTKTISQLDIKDHEGLAFGNVFLYSKETHVLFYEINKDSIYLDYFKTFLYKCFKDSSTLCDIKLNISFNTIFRKNEYERALRMEVYKSFKMKVHQPKKLIEAITHANSSLEKKIDLDFFPEIKKAAELNSYSAEIEFNAKDAKKNGGLYREKVEPLIKSFKNLLGLNQIRENIDIIEVCGYTQDNSSSKTQIELLGDVYCTNFKLRVPRLDSNLLQNERKNLIIEVFEREQSILSNYL